MDLLRLNLLSVFLLFGVNITATWWHCQRETIERTMLNMLDFHT